MSTNPMSSIRSVGRQSLSRQVEEHMKADILSGAFLPGEPLVENNLATRYGTSKTPIREALLMLAQAGLVENTAFRSWRVRFFTRKDAVEIYQLRELIEPFGLRLAVPQVTAEDLEMLDSLLSEAREAIASQDLLKLSYVNRMFHERLMAKCGNTRLAHVLDNARDQLRAISVQLWQVEPTYEHEMRQHEQILAAVRTGDAECAAERLRTHIVEFRQRYIQKATERSSLPRRGDEVLTR